LTRKAWGSDATAVGRHVVESDFVPFPGLVIRRLGTAESVSCDAAGADIEVVLPDLHGRGPVRDLLTDHAGWDWVFGAIAPPAQAVPVPHVGVNPIHWNPWHKAVIDHRAGTVVADLTDHVRGLMGLPVPWSEMCFADSRACMDLNPGVQVRCDVLCAARWMAIQSSEGESKSHV
jgi:hypothetical protein